MVALLAALALAGCSAAPEPAVQDSEPSPSASPSSAPTGQGSRSASPSPSAGPRPSPTLAIDWSPRTPAPGQDVRFDAKAEGLGSRTVDAYGWEFGDNATASGKSPTHRYAEAGRREVTGRAILSDGTIVQAKRALTVAAPSVPLPSNATAPEAAPAPTLPGSEGCNLRQSTNPRPESWYSLGKPDTYYDDGCFHQYTVNDPDTATMDVLIIPAAGALALRDARLVRDSVLMWQDGLKAGARTHGMDWLADGLTLTPMVLGVDVPAGASALAPDIVVVLQDVGPAGITWAYAGIGTDGPLSYCRPLMAAAEGRLAPPQELQAMPNFDGHHGRGWGTLSVACENGARTCVVAGAVLYSLPSDDQAINLYDLMSHEFGHCLGLGHVGDASDFAALAYPPNDIMSYEQDDLDPGVALCVSNLNLKTFAARYRTLIAGAPPLPFSIDAEGYVTMLGGADPTTGSAMRSPLPETTWRVFRADGSESPTVLDCPQPDLALL